MSHSLRPTQLQSSDHIHSAPGAISLCASHLPASPQSSISPSLLLRPHACEKSSWKRSPIFKKPTRPHLFFLSPFSIRASPKFSLPSLLGWSFPLPPHPAPQRLQLAACSAHPSCAQTPKPAHRASLLPETLICHWAIMFWVVLLLTNSSFWVSADSSFSEVPASHTAARASLLATFASSCTCTAQGITSNPLILYIVCDRTL